MQAARPDARLRHATALFLLVGVTEVLVVLGALVRAHEAGLACPDWPLCFGQVLPEMDLQIAFEWSHRALAGSVSLCFATLLALILRSGSAPRETRRWLLLAAALLLAQILLGALTVWRLLAAWTVTSHLVTGNAFALSLFLAATSLREDARGGPRRRASAPLRAALVATAFLLLLQLVLGGLVSSRFAGMACPEWPTCNGGVWLPTLRGNVGLHWLHRWNGTLLAALVLLLAFCARRAPGLRAATGIAAGLAVLQVGVGIANVLLAIPVEVTGLHSALAALLVLAVGHATRAGLVASSASSPGSHS